MKVKTQNFKYTGLIPSDMGNPYIYRGLAHSSSK